MNDFYRSIVRELAKSGGSKIIRGNNISNINPIKEWIKWLSYEPEHEIERKKVLYQKIIKELTIDELNEIVKYKSRERMVTLFKKYDNGQCSYNEYMEVYDYMGKSISNLMLDKLNKQELTFAKEEITRLSKISKEELKIKIKKEQSPEIYNKLSMVDSYILHVISDINYHRSINKLNKEIKEQLDRNALMREKSLYCANHNI